MNVLCIAAVIYLVNNEVVVDPIEAVELAVAVEASENSVELVTETTDVQESPKIERDELDEKEARYLEFIKRNWPYEKSTDCFKSEVWYTNNQKPIVQNYSYEGSVILNFNYYFYTVEF